VTNILRFVCVTVLSVALSFPVAAQDPTTPTMNLARTTPVLVQDGTIRLTDPTALTTAALEKSIAALRELIDAKLLGFEKRMKDVDADLSFRDARNVKRLDEVPGQIHGQLDQLQALMLEKFKGVDQQFQGRDTALAAALLAQKTSVDEQNKANAASSAKSEGATTKQIDGIQAIILANIKNTDDKIDAVKILVSTQAKALDDKIVDLRSAISDVRSQNVANSSRSSGQTDIIGYIVGGLGLLFAFAALMLRARDSFQPHRAGV
jgi:hypothetical protein